MATLAPLPLTRTETLETQQPRWRRRRETRADEAALTGSRRGQTDKETDMNDAKTHAIAQQPAAQELDSASLDLVVGGGIIVHESTDRGGIDQRKQEQSEKLNGEHQGKGR